jgi:hypothetical protein
MNLRKSYPPPLDFERASLAWVTKDNSHGRWRLIASAVRWSPRAGPHDRFVLSPRIMAGDVFGCGKLPRDPPYGFQIVASSQRHVIIRDFEQGLPNRDTSHPNLEIFTQLVINAPALLDGSLDPDLLPIEPLARSWPLTARIHAVSAGVDHFLDFPVVHINTRQSGGGAAFQAETGPILLPAELLDDAALTIGGFALAFVFFNRLDRVDLAIWGPTGTGSSPRRGYVHFGRLEGIVIELYGGNRHHIAGAEND